jgi:hypothetical protein
MKRNIGTIDRVIRIVLGLAIGILGLVFKNWLSLIAILFLATAAVGTCPIYLGLGLSTRRKA